MEGAVGRISEAESDAYFATRPRGAQLAANVSPQSEPLESREALEARFAELDAAHPNDVPRPPHWGGYRLVPETYEFWRHRENRLHDRRRYQLAEGGWSIERLAP